MSVTRFTTYQPGRRTLGEHRDPIGVGPGRTGTGRPFRRELRPVRDIRLGAVPRALEPGKRGARPDRARGFAAYHSRGPAAARPVVAAAPSCWPSARLRADREHLASMTAQQPPLAA